jgi:hypothetical protein
VDRYSADDRKLFETSAAQLFEEAVSAGQVFAHDPRIVEGGELHEAFGLLVRLGLLTPGAEADSYIPVDPSGAQSRVVSPLGQEGAKLLEESSHWAQAFGSLSQAWRKAPQNSERGPFTYLHGAQAIGAFIGAAMAEADEEVLSAQPQTGRDTGRGLSGSLELERAVLERGGRILTLYQHSARRSMQTRAYVAAAADLGAEVRTLDEFFHRIIVVDRQTAIIPSPSDLATALAIREPTVVAYLVDVFMRSWERARPFTSRDVSVVKQIAEEQRAMTMRMLVEGYSDPVSAKRLGVSPRTYAGYVADLKEEFDSETRFQLGYKLGSQGIPTDGIQSDPDGT